MAVYKNEDGRTYYFRGKIRLPNGEIKYYKQTKVKYSKKKDAANAEEEYRQSLLAKSEQITFGELAVLFKNRWKLQNIDETTIVTYENYYQRHLKDYFENMYLNEITPKIVEEFKLYMVNKRKEDGTRYAERTINNTKTILSRYFSFAISMGYVSSNPCHTVKRYVDTSKKNDPFEKKENFWEVDEFKKFINEVDDPFWNAVFIFLFETGVREGEMFALTWENVFFNEKKIRIRQSISGKCFDKNKTYRVKAPKNKRSYREIDIQDNLIEILSNLFEHAKKIDGFNISFYVFGDIRPLSRSTLARHLDKYILLSGVKRITPHGFRHSHASLLIKEKVDDNLIAERLGHTVEELRRTYAHVYSSSRSDLINKLNSIFG